MASKFEQSYGGDANSRVSAHEAGHALVAWLSPALNVLGTEWLEDRVMVRIKQKEPVTRYTIWEQMATLAGGIAAEMVTYGDFRTGPSRSDLAGMRMAADGLCAPISSAPLAPWDPPEVPKPIPFQSYYADPLGPHRADIMRIAYRRARERILSHRGAYERLRTGLIVTMEMTAEQIGETLRLKKA